MASEVVVLQFEEYLRIYLIVLIYEFIRFTRICTISSCTEGYERKRACAEFFAPSLISFESVYVFFFSHGFHAELLVSSIGRIRDVYIGMITSAERF